jgi:short-subunit dehydrogenase
LTNALRLELEDTGIKVTLIEPGPIRSRFVENAMNNLLNNIDIENSPHRDLYLRRIEGMRAGGKSVFKLEPSAVSKRLIHAVESSRPRRRYYVTTPTYLAALFNRIMPPAAAEYFAKKF